MTPTCSTRTKYTHTERERESGTLNKNNNYLGLFRILCGFTFISDLLYDLYILCPVDRAFRWLCCNCLYGWCEKEKTQTHTALFISNHISQRWTCFRLRKTHTTSKRKIWRVCEVKWQNRRKVECQRTRTESVNKFYPICSALIFIVLI